MYIKLSFKETINNKQMYSPRLYTYQDSYVLYTPTVLLWFVITYTQSFGTDTYT